MRNLPLEYQWLAKEKGPRILKEFLKLYGTKEVGGVGNNATIIAWAKEVGGWIGNWYNKDSIPWCGLAMAVAAKRAKFPFNQKALSALAWADWGTPVEKPMLGDVLVFKRKGGGHVGLYVGEDDMYYHVLGGNQSDAVNIARLDKNRLYAVRRCPWRFFQPRNVRSIELLASKADVSLNEA